MFLSSISSYPIGLDISDLSFKFVQLKRERGGLGVQALGKIEIPKGIIVGGDIQDEEKALVLLKKMFSKPKFGKVKTDRIVACLPEAKTFVKLIEIRKTANKIEDLVETEIKKHIPLDIKNMYYDWQSIRELESGYQLVLVGAAPKEIVNKYISFLDKAGFSIEALEIEPISVCRSLLKEEFNHLEWKERKNYVILDIGATRSSIIFYSRNTILFTASISVSIPDIEKSEETAFTKINKKSKEALEFYYNNFSKRGGIDVVYVCGGGASIDEIKKGLKDIFSVSVKNGNGATNIKNKDITKYFSGDKYYLPSFVTAIGLALSKVDIKK